MILTIDVGGTKVLGAIFTDGGKLIKTKKLKTHPEYSDFIQELREIITDLTADEQPIACSIAIPGTLDRENGVVLHLGNLPWHDAPIAQDIAQLISCPIYIENDAKMACIAEAHALRGHYSRVLYVTVSTGIGFGLVVDGKLDYSISDDGGHDMMVKYRGKMQAWESFASGKAIVARTGKLASEITDPGQWDIISGDIAIGLASLIEQTTPQAVVIGGGVGAHLERFHHPLFEHLEARLAHKGLSVPELRKAQHPEEAVVYGGYLLAQQHLQAEHHE